MTTKSKGFDVGEAMRLLTPLLTRDYRESRFAHWKGATDHEVLCQARNICERLHADGVEEGEGKAPLFPGESEEGGLR